MFLKTIEDDFISGNFDSSEIEKGFDEIIEYNQIKVALSTTINQKNKGNMTTIDLKECEIILKDVYNISYNETLFIKKIEVIQEEMMIPKIEFEVYYKLNRTNLIKLNLSYCTNIKIDIFIPIKLEGNLDIFNSSSGYYNDLCYTATSDYGTDIILKDRRNEFIENNKAVCQENCVFSEYDNIFQKVKCTCDVPKSSDKFENIKIDKSKLLNNFIDIKNIANINFLLCYKVLFTKKGIINNYGSYSIIFIIIIHFIIIIIFYFKKLLNEINDRIKEIPFGVKYIKLHKKQILENKRKIKKRKRKIKKIKNTIKEKINYKKVKNINNILQINFDINSNENSKEPLSLQKFKKLPKNKSNIRYNKNINETENINKNAQEILNKVKKIMYYNDEELNNLPYNSALKIDKRNYCNYYLSLLKTKHPIFFTFFNNDDYNIKIIKIDLLLFNFVLFFAINTLFFTDDTMHKIDEDKGVFNFIYQLPQIIYSSLLPYIFTIPLEKLSLTEETIIELKEIKENKEFNEKAKKVIYKLKIKFILYFIISIIFLVFFWYYISIFCAIYANTQIHLIKDTLFSFVSSLIEPFYFYLIPGIFRIPSLSNREKNRYILYKFSIIFQTIFEFVL